MSENSGERWGGPLGGPPGPRGSPRTRYLKHRQKPAAGRRGRRPRTGGVRPTLYLSIRDCPRTKPIRRSW
jgi:hypothetical protein